MIYLNEGANTVITTLNTGTQTTYYTWQLINKDSMVETVFYQDDTSTSQDFYNKFIITITSSIGLTAGQINIPKAEYQYTIYKMSSQYDLNIASASGVAERGILRYIGPDLWNRPEPTIQNFAATGSTIKTFDNL